MHAQLPRRARTAPSHGAPSYGAPAPRALRSVSISRLRSKEIREILLGMPFVRILSNQPSPTPERAEALLTEVSRCASKLLGKPERWVMTCIDPSSPMTFAGTTGPSCYIELKNIGSLSPKLTAQLSAELCAIVENHLSVPPDRTYVEFCEATGHLWGYNGSTFG